MPIRITDRSQAAIHHSWAECIVSLDDPGSDLEVSGPQHGLFLFRDLLGNDPEGPTLEVCQAILNHVQSCHATLASRMLVHCQAGISRSPAVALGILVSQGLPLDLAWRWVRRARPSAWPNVRVVEHFDALLECRGELASLANRIDQWRCRRGRSPAW